MPTFSEERVTARTTSPAHSNAHSATAVSTNSHGHCGTVAQDEPWEQVQFGCLRLRSPVSRGRALPTVIAPRVAKELIQLFARVGIPEEILMDQGPNFILSLLEELYLLLQIRRIQSTPYHPQTDGLVERFNGTLKSMLRKFVADSQNDWDTYLPYVLFAYREVPQESTGFSPFQLLYGRRVKGPLDVLQECWTEGEQNG